MNIIHPPEAVESIADGIQTAFTIDGLGAAIEIIENQTEELLNILKRFHRMRYANPNDSDVKTFFAFQKYIQANPDTCEMISIIDMNDVEDSDYGEE